MPGSGSNKKGLTAAQRKEQTKERLKKRAQDEQARINAQNAAKGPAQEEKMNAASIKAANNQAAKDAEKNKLQAIANSTVVEIRKIVNSVIELRKNNPSTTGINAGDKNIPGGSDTPIPFNGAVLSLMTTYGSSFEGSVSAAAKFRIQVSGQKDILIHVKPE